MSRYFRRLSHGAVLVFRHLERSELRFDTVHNALVLARFCVTVALTGTLRAFRYARMSELVRPRAEESLPFRPRECRKCEQRLTTAVCAEVRVEEVFGKTCILSLILSSLLLRCFECAPNVPLLWHALHLFC